MSIKNRPKPSPLPADPARVHTVVSRNVQALIVNAARPRVPDLKVPAGEPKVAARARLKLARAHFAKTANPFLSRAARRDLAKGVKLA